MKLQLTAAVIFAYIATATADIAVTVYNQDLALVRESREFDFPKDTGELRFTDVAAQIIPTSVHFNSSKASLLEQNYEYDLVSADKLMSKYIDRQVRLAMEDGNLIVGKLLSATGDVVVEQTDGGIRSLARDKVVDVSFPDLPEGLITRPTLVWMTESNSGGKGDAEISYLTRGMNWEAEYVAVADNDDKSLSLTGWVNITNNSGATYKEARIKLMAGDVQILKDEEWRGRGRRDIRPMFEAAAHQFEEQAFYEYHLYTLKRPTTLGQNQVKQISLFPTAHTPVKKEYRFGYGTNDKVKVTLEFENRKQVGLGIPLPKGKTRVYKEGPDGGLEFVGEDRIDHTPNDEKVRISTGNAFDVIGERKTLDFKKQGNTTEEEIEIKIRNHKDEKVSVIIAEYMQGTWEIISGTPGWEKKSANLVEWIVEVKSGEEQIVKFRVFRSW